MKIKKPYFQPNRPLPYGTAMIPKVIAINLLLRGIHHLLEEPDRWGEHGYLSRLLVDRAMKYLFRESLLPELMRRIDAAVNLYNMAHAKDAETTITLFAEIAPIYAAAQERIYHQKRSLVSSGSYTAKAEALINKYVDTYESQFGTLISFVVACRRIYTNEKLVSGQEFTDMDTTEKIRDIEKSIIPPNNPISVFKKGLNPHLRNARSHGNKITHNPEKEETVIKDRRGYTERFSLNKIGDLLDDIVISVDALEISWIIFQINHAKELQRNPAWQTGEPSKADIEAIISEGADEYGFELIEGEEIDAQNFWILLRRKPGTVSMEPQESEVMIGLKGGGGIRSPFKIPGVKWSTRDQVLGFVSRATSVLARKYISITIELEEGKKSRSYLKVKDLPGFLEELKRLSQYQDKKKAKTEANTTIVKKYIETNIRD